MPRVDFLNYEVECLGGRQDVPEVIKILWNSIIIIINHNPLTAEFINLIFCEIITSNASDVQSMP